MYVQRHAEALKGKEVLRRVRRSRRGFHGGGGGRGRRKGAAGLKAEGKGETVFGRLRRDLAPRFTMRPDLSPSNTFVLERVSLLLPSKFA